MTFNHHSSLVLFQMLLLLGLASAKRFSCFPEYCLHDKDYEELLSIVKYGLEPTMRPSNVVIVGAGISGLTAAKLLRDAGHKVRGGTLGGLASGSKGFPAWSEKSLIRRGGGKGGVNAFLGGLMRFWGNQYISRGINALLGESMHFWGSLLEEPQTHLPSLPFTGHDSGNQQ